MTFCLKSKIIKPEKEIKNAIILLHGYGGDGNDISMLSLNWKRHLPNTIFICPNGHETCEINPSGYQWFDLTKDDPNYILKETKKAEEILKKFINEVKEEYNLTNNNICLSGFSQGCMMSLNVGLTSEDKFSSIVGFSGKIINQSDLKQRIKNLTDVFLIHGELDDIVSPTFLLEKCPALVLNADYRPLSYYPLSLWSWQDTVKSVFLDRVIIVSKYDREIRSPSFSMQLPSVIALKDYIVPQAKPSFTRFNVFLRDKFSCQYCGSKEELTFDHLLPRSKGGETNWDNVVTACSTCNVKKGGKLLKFSGMKLNQHPYRPSTEDLHKNGKNFPPNFLHKSWMDYLYWDVELES